MAKIYVRCYRCSKKLADLEIKGPFDELMFKPAPDRTELDRNPVSYS